MKREKIDKETDSNVSLDDLEYLDEQFEYQQNEKNKNYHN